jgi:hypothetical protein
MPTFVSWRCAACGCSHRMAERLRTRAGLPPLEPDAFACSQACALALVEREIASADALMRDRGPQPLAYGSPPQLARRAAYLHVVSTLT